MALKRQDVAITAVVAFISWGFLTHWIPLLRYLGYAFVAGVLVSCVLLISPIVLSFKSKQEDENQEGPPRTAAFLAKDVWLKETSWLAASAEYKKTPLIPSSFLVSDSLDGLLEWVIRDFVLSWYGNITARPKFPNEIDKAVRSAILKVKERAKDLDMVEIAVSRFVPLFTAHLKDFYDAEHAVRGKKLNRNVTESEELDLAIAGKYKDGKLHPAASLAFADTKLVQQEYLRKLVVRLMPEILPESMMKSKAVSVIIKEIVACAVLASVMQMLSDPDTWNQLMEAYVRCPSTKLMSPQLIESRAAP
jgi:sorting nexin-25